MRGATDTAPQANGRPWRGGWRDGFTYGSLGLPLAFVELPLYVVLLALSSAYCLLPCALELVAVAILYLRWIRIGEGQS